MTGASGGGPGREAAVLAIDLGTTEVKVGLVSLEGGQVAAERVMHHVHARLVVRAGGHVGLPRQAELLGLGSGDRGH